MSVTTQQYLLKVRPPRVKIVYEVETGGALEKRSLIIGNRIAAGTCVVVRCTGAGLTFYFYQIGAIVRHDQSHPS